ncbi:bleomycin resistance protein [Aliiroseovarius sp. 2305UL8-7]|uniref:bleomycin resistance protein n=1 Tax=Aliiroseovarius conchicola TaxID=3121637 RepID=UPI00352875B9
MMSNPIVPELAVTDWLISKQFYCSTLEFEVLYERPEEGFAYLRYEEVEIMIDQIGLGRTFGNEYLPTQQPFGKGLNLQIRISSITPLAAALSKQSYDLYLPVEERWYRRDDTEIGQRQFVVADPDGYLLRFCDDLGVRPIARID